MCFVSIHLTMPFLGVYLRFLVTQPSCLFPFHTSPESILLSFHISSLIFFRKPSTFLAYFLNNKSFHHDPFSKKVYFTKSSIANHQVVVLLSLCFLSLCGGPFLFTYSLSFQSCFRKVCCLMSLQLLL